MSSNQYDTSGQKRSNPFFKDPTPNPIYTQQMAKKPVTSNATLNSTSYNKVETAALPPSLPQYRPSLGAQFGKFKTPAQKNNAFNLNMPNETSILPVVVSQIPKQPLPTVQKKTPLTKPRLFPENSPFNQPLRTLENDPNLKKLDLSSRVKKKDEQEPKLPLAFGPIEIPQVSTHNSILDPDDVIIEDSGEHDLGIKHSPMELPTYQNMTFSEMPFSQFEKMEQEKKKEEEDFGDSSTDTDMPELQVPNFEVPTLNVSDLDIEIPDLDSLTENLTNSIQTLGKTVDMTKEKSKKFIASNRELLAKALNKSTDDITKDIASFVASDLKRKARPTPTEEVLPSKVAKIDEIPKLLTKDITIHTEITEVPKQPEVPVQLELVVQPEEEPYRLVKLGNGKWELLIDPNTQDELVMRIKK